MTWTYDVANLASSRKDEVRYMVGDTDEMDPMLQDEEIALILAQNTPPVGRPAWMAAAAACDAIAGKFGRQINGSVGPLSSSASQMYDHYVALAQQFRVLYATNGAGVIGGSMAGVKAAAPILGGGGKTYLGGTDPDSAI